MRRRGCDRNARGTAFGAVTLEPTRGVTLARRSGSAADAAGDAATQARRRRSQRRIRQIMARKYTGRQSRIRQHVRCCPLHSEHSRKASTERSVMGGVVRDASERAVSRRAQDRQSTTGSRTAQGREEVS